MKRLPDLSPRREALLAHLETILPNPGQRRDFRSHMLEPPPACVRLNSLMPQYDLMRSHMQGFGEAVPWCADAFVLPSSPQTGVGKSLEFALGCLYIQAKATTLAVEALAPEPGERVLDLAAAPGGKASQIAARMNNTGLLVANEPSSRRLSSLVGNLDRCLVHNAIFTKATGSLLARYFHNFFDRVLLDAPCSGDGILRKDQTVLEYWSVEDAIHKSGEQLGLLRAAFHMLRPGGVLVYSTCSLSTEENERVLLGLLRTYGESVEIMAIDGVELAPPLPRPVADNYPSEFGRVMRIWPHLHETEGAFVAKLTKRGETTWREVSGNASEALSSNLEEASHETATSVTPGPHDECFGAVSGYNGVTSPIDGRAYVEERWQFEMRVPPDQELAVEGRRLQLRPRGSIALQTLPYFVRAGMRLAGIHKGHLHLTHQAVSMWGHQFRGPRIPLTWPQVLALFRGERAHRPDPADHKGEAIFCFGPWTICRGLVEAGGRTLQGFLPASLRSAQVHALFDYQSS